MRLAAIPLLAAKMPGMKTLLTQDELKARAHYDPTTGFFTSRITGKILVSTEAQGYRVMRLSKKCTHKQHRLAFLYMTGEWPKGVVDHINGNKTDNRWENLRDVTIQMNLQNTSKARKNSTTGLLGVYPHGKRFFSQIQVSGKFIRIGTFDCAVEAHIAYLTTKQKLHEGFVA
jgi:hypothetical protein